MNIKKDKQKRDKELVKALNRAVKTCLKSPLYLSLLKKPLKISSIKDIDRLPFTTKQDLRNWYPYGNLAVEFSDVVETHMTSGTTGKPTLSFYTKEDLKESSKAIAVAWKNFGIDKNSRVQFMMSYGLFSGAPLNTYAIQSLGAFVLPAGIQPTSKQIQLMQDFDIDTLVATPSYYLHLYDQLRKNNVSLKKLKLKRAIAAGEAYSDKTKKKISNLFSIEVFDHYGLCEVNTGIIYECKKCHGMSVLKNHVYAEIVDPSSNTVLPINSPGELVLTALDKAASPILRYRTGDITKIKTYFSECKNCYGSIIIDRIKLRKDSTIFYKGIKLEPFELRDMIISFMGNNMYHRIHIKVPERTFKTKPTIILSLRKKDDAGLLLKLRKFLKERTGVLFNIKEVPYIHFADFTSTKDNFVEYVK